MTAFMAWGQQQYMITVFYKIPEKALVLIFRLSKDNVDNVFPVKAVSDIVRWIRLNPYIDGNSTQISNDCSYLYLYKANIY